MTDLVAIRSDKNVHVKQIAVISGKGGTGKTSLVDRLQHFRAGPFWRTAT